MISICIKTYTFTAHYISKNKAVLFANRTCTHIQPPAATSFGTLTLHICSMERLCKTFVISFHFEKNIGTYPLCMFRLSTSWYSTITTQPINNLFCWIFDLCHQILENLDVIGENEFQNRSQQDKTYLKIEIFFWGIFFCRPGLKRTQKFF